MPRLGVAAVLIPALFTGAVLPAARVSVVVVSEAGVDAYNEALDGVTAVLPAGTFRVVDVAGKSFERDISSAMGGSELSVLMAVGSRALTEVRMRHPSTPVVAVMVLHQGDAETAVRRVDLDIPLGAQLGAMRTLWPGRTRAGVIRDPARARYATDAMEACARKEGFSLLSVDCDGPAHLLKAIAALQGKVDFVLCFPDPELYNPVTIKPLVLASLEHRLPLVGFSPAVVRAGAAVGIFPDYPDMGRQAAEMALRLLRGEERTADESPRKMKIAINQRVAHLLGVEFRGGALAVEVYR